MNNTAMNANASSPPQYRIAGRLSKEDLTLIDTGGEFAERIRKLFADSRPKKIIETGTYFGTGTTTIIANTIKALAIEDATFYSIEVNPRHYSKALAHITREGLNVKPLNGLSVPRSLLPSLAEIEQRYVSSVLADQLIVDHEPDQRTEFYFRETDFPHLQDDLLGQILAEFGNKADFVLLDSGGHMGYVEFQYLTSKLRSPCWIALDDIFHVKHHLSFKDIETDPRFVIETVSREKFGFCIARFTPAARSKRKENAA